MYVYVGGGHTTGTTVVWPVVFITGLCPQVVVHVAKLLGLSYHEAADGTEALERLRVDKYSVGFMDHQMVRVRVYG